MGQDFTCLLCGSNEYFTHLTGLSSVYEREYKFEILNCSICELKHTNPLPTKQQLNYLYSEKYSYSSHELVKIEKSMRARSLISLSRAYFNDSSILELGCGSGVLLREFVRQGFKAKGVEHSTAAIEGLNTDHGWQIENLSIEDFFLTNSENFHNIVISHTLEHLVNPVVIAKNIFEALADGGTLVVVVPNSTGLTARLLKGNWGYWQTPIHITHFEEKTLVQLLEGVGFHIERVAKRNIDFLGLALILANILRLKSEGLQPGRLAGKFITFLSTIWHLFYRIGDSDLIVIAKKL